MAKVIGIGGVFLRARDPKALAAWYAENLGITKESYGLVLRPSDDPNPEAMTLFSYFPADTKYFGEGEQQVMINFRVDDIDGVVEQLTKAGARIDPKRDDHEYGRFAWFWDPEGNRVELWAPAAE